MDLTDLSYYLRKYFPYAMIFVIVFFILFYSVKLFLVYLTFNKPVTFNPRWGAIKKPEIKGTIDPTGFSYTLDTVEGAPTTATMSANVYFLPPTVATFGYREKVYLMAKTLGFDTENTKYNLDADSQAVFNEKDQHLSVNITNFNFSYKLNYEQKPEIFDKTIIPPEKEITDRATNFLTQVDRYPQELAQGRNEINYYYYNVSTQELTKASPGQDANMVEVDFYRPDTNGFINVNPIYPQSQNYVQLVFNSDNFRILKAQIKFFEKSDTQIEVYPLKTGDEAWGKLASGSAIIVKAPQNTKDIVIKKMSLGYLDPDYYQEYLQPVYVFLGDNGFTAYVAALADKYLAE